MNFGFSEDQTMIRKSANDFVKGESSLERIRALREDTTGYSPELYQQIANNGWVGAVLPEEYGGVGLGFVDLICILEEFGKGLLPEPIISSAILGGNTILQGGTEEQKSELLPVIAGAALKATLAAYELSGRFNLAHVETTATESGDGYVLNGRKDFVPDAATADKLIVSARTSGGTADTDGITLFILEKDTAGLTLTPIQSMDYRPRSTMTLENVQVSAANMIGEVGQALPVIDHSIDRATVALCAEQVGGMEEALSRTVAYTQERVQFDKPIASFQALKHKAADMFVHLEMARSNMYYAAMALDNDMPDLRKSISAAKTTCSNGFIALTKEAIQLHGGIGYTDEHDIHFFYKRAMTSNVTFGDPRYHRERYLSELANPADVASELLESATS